MNQRRIIIGRGPVPPRKQMSAPAPIEPFTFKEIELIQKGKIKGCLITGSLRPPRPDQLKPLRKIVRVLDGDGNETGELQVERLAAPLTIRTVTPVIDLTIIEDVIIEQRVRRLALRDEHARLCGRRDALELRDHWLTTHPRSPLVRLVTFAYQDQRDPAYFMARGNGYTTAPAQSIDREAQAVTGDALAWIGAQTRAKPLSPMMATKQKRSLGIQLKEAPNDPTELRRIAEDVSRLADELDREAA